MEKIKNFIDGESVEPKTGSYIDNFDPSIGEVYSQVADSDVRDVDLAVAAAKRAFPAWSATSVRERARLLRNLSFEIEKRADALALAESIDNGKPLKVAHSIDMTRAVLNFEVFADAITQFSTECFISDQQSAINYTMRSPLGVVGCISPWNLPLYLLTWKIAPALAAGNCVVAKPSELTPMTAYLFSKICQEVGFPPGVLNIVHGLGAKAGAALVAHSDVKAISFTGGTKTGSDIARAVAPHFKKVSLEMGGKNPNIVFADADFGEAVKEAVRAAFSNQGQICLCGSRIYVQETIYEKFKNEMVAQIRNLKVGDPLEMATDQGAIVSKPHYEKILSYLEIAKKEGGEILIGGKPATVNGRCSKGWFIEPTLIEGLGESCRTNQEEIFGPVATIQPFKSEEEAVRLANATRYGLSSSVWTGDIDRAHRVARQIEAGVVWINSWMLRDPRTLFGGVKDSGVGREGGFEALRFFTEPKNV